MTEKGKLPIQDCFVGLDDELESFVDHFKISIHDEYLPVIELGFIITSESAQVASQIITEVATVAMELLKDDDLSDYIAYLLHDDSGEMSDGLDVSVI